MRMVNFAKKLIFATLFSLPLLAQAIPNPASVYCIQQRNQLLLIQETGICLFSDNSYCEEWSFYRKKCKTGQYYWPEKTISYSALKKYCIKKNNNQIVINLCSRKEKTHEKSK